MSYVQTDVKKDALMTIDNDNTAWSRQV